VASGQAPAAGWSIEWRGLTLASHETTGRHAVIVAAVCERDDWHDCDPRSGPVAAVAWIAATISTITGRTVEQAMHEVLDAPLTEIAGAIST
jgi:hypothetical protein